MEILGIITARGGSKSIPRKNIKELAGKPLLVYTIEVARESGVISRLILSTDDEEIAAMGRSHGVEIPFLRPKELAEDSTPHIAVLQHAVATLQNQEGYWPDYVVLLQPTAPLRQPHHVKEALELLVATGADSVVSVSEVPGHHNPHWVFSVDDFQRLQPFMGGNVADIVKRRQDLPKVYTRNGAIYAFKPQLLFDERRPSFYGGDVRAYVMSPEYSVNLDTIEDWHLAERLVEQFRNQKQ